MKYSLSRSHKRQVHRNEAKIKIGDSNSRETHSGTKGRTCPTRARKRCTGCSNANTRLPMPTKTSRLLDRLDMHVKYSAKSKLQRKPVSESGVKVRVQILDELATETEKLRSALHGTMIPVYF